MVDADCPEDLEKAVETLLERFNHGHYDRDGELYDIAILDDSLETLWEWDFDTGNKGYV